MLNPLPNQNFQKIYTSKNRIAWIHTAHLPSYSDTTQYYFQHRFTCFKWTILYHISNLTQEKNSFSDLDHLLSRDVITEDGRPSTASRPNKWTAKNSPIKTSLTLFNIIFTPTEKPTNALNATSKKRKSTTPSRQLFQKQKKKQTNYT